MKTEWKNISGDRAVALGLNVAEREVGIFSLLVYEDWVSKAWTVTTHPLVLSERLGKVGEMSQAQAERKAERLLQGIADGITSGLRDNGGYNG